MSERERDWEREPKEETPTKQPCKTYFCLVKLIINTTLSVWVWITWANFASLPWQLYAKPDNRKPANCFHTSSLLLPSKSYRWNGFDFLSFIDVCNYGFNATTFLISVRYMCMMRQGAFQYLQPAKIFEKPTKKIDKMRIKLVRELLKYSSPNLFGAKTESLHWNVKYK